MENISMVNKQGSGKSKKLVMGGDHKRMSFFHSNTFVMCLHVVALSFARQLNKTFI